MTAGVALDPLEIASGLVFGHVREPSAPDPGLDPLRALVGAAREALLRPPCLVSFSGGRDSSAVLAVAAAVARREGLPLPVPVTNRFAAVQSSREDEWQERVIAHLGVEDWVRLDLADELDCVGPYARRALASHGLLWPFNAHFHAPLFEAARGGSLLTGIGGDEILGESSWARAVDVLAARVRPQPRDVRRVAFYVAPSAVRRPWISRRLPLAFGWLRPDARRELVRRWTAQAASEPRLPRRHARWRGSFRYERVGVDSLDRLARAQDVRAVHPFLDARFREALARAEDVFRFRTRTEAFRALVGTVLPEDVLSRSTKSSFDGAFFAAPSRAFAADWDGGGVDHAVVDVEALRAEWLGDAPDARSFLALQAAWLAARSGAQRGDERGGHRRELLPAPGASQLQAR
jgi:hypothetical protein